MMILLGLAILLIVGAGGAIFTASRMSSQNRVKHWTGEATTVSESHKRHAQIRWLRLGAALCIVLLAVDAVAIYTLANYAATH